MVSPVSIENQAGCRINQLGWGEENIAIADILQLFGKVKNQIYLVCVYVGAILMYLKRRVLTEKSVVMLMGPPPATRMLITSQARTVHCVGETD